MFACVHHSKTVRSNGQPNEQSNGPSTTAGALNAVMLPMKELAPKNTGREAKVRADEHMHVHAFDVRPQHQDSETRKNSLDCVVVTLDKSQALML